MDRLRPVSFQDPPPFSRLLVSVLVLAASFVCLGAAWGRFTVCHVRIVDQRTGKPLGTLETRLDSQGDSILFWKLNEGVYPNGKSLRLETTSHSETTELDSKAIAPLRVEQPTTISSPKDSDRESLEATLRDEVENSESREYLVKSIDPGTNGKILSALFRERVVTQAGRVYLRETWRLFEGALPDSTCANVVIQPGSKHTDFESFLKKYPKRNGEMIVSRDRYGSELSGAEGLEP